MSVKKRFMEHLAEKGAIPKRCAFGGKIRDEDEWEDDGYNDHSDTSGEPMYYMAEGGTVPSAWDNLVSNLKSGKAAGNNSWAFGGKIEAPEHGDDREQGMSDEEIRHHLAMSLKRRKQLPRGA